MLLGDYDDDDDDCRKRKKRENGQMEDLNDHKLSERIMRRVYGGLKNNVHRDM